MERHIRYGLGVDMSKNTFDACLSAMDEGNGTSVRATRKFPNTPGGFAGMETWTAKHARQKVPLTIAVEVTGVYHQHFALHFQGKGHHVSVVLPDRAKHYLKALGHKSKDDRSDARGLATMALRMDLEPWTPAGRFFSELRQLTRYHQGLQESRTVTANQLHALEHGAYRSKEVCRQIKRSLALADKQIARVKEAIHAHLATDAQISRKVGRICKVKGLGELTVATVLAETDGFALFRNQRQLVSYAGYDVVENQSGSRVGRTRISKKGNSRIRRILHMGAFGAVRHGQEPFLSLYERVYASTLIKMKAYVAVQKKLLVLIYTLYKKDEEFKDPGSQKSGNLEREALFPVSREGLKTSDPALGRVTQDERPSNLSQVALFPVAQT